MGLKKKLAETEQAPKFIREVKEVRLKEGQRARFECGFAGYPRPEVTWNFQGEVLKNSSKVQIKVREDSSTLTIIDCTFDEAGMYECRASNALGTDKTKGSLTVNKMTAQEKADYEKLKANGLQAAVDDEEKKEEVKKTYDWKKGVKKVEKKPVEEAKAPEKVQLKKAKPVEKQKEETKEGVKLKPIPGKEKTQPEKAEPVKLKPVPAKEKKEEEVKKPAPKGTAPQKIVEPKEDSSTLTI